MPEIPTYIESTAAFSPCQLYRYELTRVWERDKPIFVVLLCNPSTADAEKLDPTLSRCVGLAKRNGCGGLAVTNIFALRSTDPYVLYDHPDPVGPENDGYIEKWARTPNPFLAGWGTHGILHRRAEKVCRLLERLRVPVKCLAITKGGMPAHPLYRRSDTVLIDFPLTVTEDVADAPAIRGPGRRGLKGAG